MAVINTNVKALFSQMALSQSGRSQTVAMQQLSTGKRINSARDDAAGMAIATRMTHQIRSLNQAVRNSGDAINLIQTAEGATNQITDMLQRMRELAVQAVNDTNDNAQRSYLDLEFQQLKQQIVQIADQTEWNGFPVLTGQAGQRVGEMPVYKSTSVSKFDEVFTSPTTLREVKGLAAGETHAIKLSGTLPADGAVVNVNIGTQTPIAVHLESPQNWKDVADQITAQVALMGKDLSVSIDDVSIQAQGQVDNTVLDPAKLKAGNYVIAGEQVAISASDLESADKLLTSVKSQLEAKPFFNVATGRTIEVDAVSKTLKIGYLAGDPSGRISAPIAKYEQLTSASKEVATIHLGASASAAPIIVGGYTFSAGPTQTLDDIGAQIVGNASSVGNYDISYDQSNSSLTLTAKTAGAITDLNVNINSVAATSSELTITQGVSDSYKVEFTPLVSGEKLSISGANTFTAGPATTVGDIETWFKTTHVPTGFAASAGSPSGVVFTATAAPTTFSISSTELNTVTDVEDSVTLNFTFDASKVNKTTGLTDVGAISLAGALTKSEEVKPAVGEVKESWGSVNGQYLQSGGLSFKLSAAGKMEEAYFVDNRNQNKVPLTGTVDKVSGEVTFKMSEGRNREVMNADLTYKFMEPKLSGATTSDPLNLTQRAMNLTVSVQGGIPAMSEGDMVINGIPIGQTLATDDNLSPPGNVLGSAIAIAAAINRKAESSNIASGEVQNISLTGAPTNSFAGSDISVGGISIRLNSSANTPVKMAEQIAAQLQSSSLWGANTGRTVSYQPGSAVVTVKYAANEGDVSPIKVEGLPGGVQSTVDTTIPSMSTTQGTGVYAKVNENVFTGSAMSGSAVVDGKIYINGFSSAEITSVFNNPRDTRANVVRAINMIADKTGVKAIDTGSDVQGISLLAIDGRNIEVRFDSSDPEFGQRIGMRQGVQAASVSLESKIQAPVIITSRGNINNTGFQVGNYSKNESVFNTVNRPTVEPAIAQVESIKIEGSNAGRYAVSINGNEIAIDSPTGASAADIRSKLMSAIYVQQNQLGVVVTAGDTIDSFKIAAAEPGIPFTATVSSSGSSMTQTSEVPNTPATAKPLTANDLVINGIKIREARPADDIDSSVVSSSSSKTASAIAIAKAINESSPETGVVAIANPAVSEGVRTDKTPADKGYQDLFINGRKVSVYLDPNEDISVRLNKVMDAINNDTGYHGAVASVNPTKDALVLQTPDGRNLSVWFDSNVKGLSAASFGLDKGGTEAQVSEMSGSDVDAPLTLGNFVSVKLNGVTVTATGDGTSKVGDLLAKKINDSGQFPNVLAEFKSGKLVLSSQVPGSAFTFGEVNSSVETLNAQIETTTANNVGKNDVVGINKATVASTTARTVYGSIRLTSEPALLPRGVPSPEGAPPSDQLDLLKATGKPFTVSTGLDGFGTSSNFSDLGFQVGSYGGQSSAAMDPPRVGRMSFQVGASANQVVTIDLADFGKNGPITSEITGDVDLNVDSRTARINTGEGATAVLAKLDLVMDRVNATRATMGAVMNRLDHVISNLTNVSMNLSESRSHIEDADYAAASTELAKTQIMQQAATAVLAQANTSQQSVLKLLGG